MSWIIITESVVRYSSIVFSANLGSYYRSRIFGDCYKFHGDDFSLVNSVHRGCLQTDFPRVFDWTSFRRTSIFSFSSTLINDALVLIRVIIVPRFLNRYMYN